MKAVKERKAAVTSSRQNCLTMGASVMRGWLIIREMNLWNPSCLFFSMSLSNLSAPSLASLKFICERSTRRIAA
jgi:hypothetical protein